MKVIEIREISVSQAKREIIEYLVQKDEAGTFEIANDLRLGLDLTTRALKELWEERSNDLQRYRRQNNR